MPLNSFGVQNQSTHVVGSMEIKKINWLVCRFRLKGIPFFNSNRHGDVKIAIGNMSSQSLHNNGAGNSLEGDRGTRRQPSSCQMLHSHHSLPSMGKVRAPIEAFRCTSKRVQALCAHSPAIALFLMRNS